jgi:hypothetical protein
MSLLPPQGDGPPSKEDLRQLESRVDARFQAVNARFATIDRRFTSVVHRLDEIEHGMESLIQRFDSRIRSLEGRFDATDARIDLMHDNMALRIDQGLNQTKRFTSRVMLTGMAGCTLSTAALCFGTVAIAI